MQRHLTTFLDGQPVGWLETLESFQRLEDEQAWMGPDKTVVGTPGNDKLHGGQGNDDIDGLAGADTMAGRLGDDTFHVDNAGDVVRERIGEGMDTVVTTVDWTLGKQVENLVLSGSLADLNGTGNKLDNLITDNYGENRIDGAAGNDTLDGGRIVSPGEADTLVGGLGDDLLLAGRLYYSSDLLQGGAGNDTLVAKLGSCSLYGGDGNDLLDGGLGGYHQGNGYLYGGAGHDTLKGGVSMDGGDGNDLLQSTVSAVQLDGGAGDDTISGSGGAGYNNLTVHAGLGNDSVDVYSGNNSLFLYGGDGDDTLTGGASINVVIDAGAGNDKVSSFAQSSGSTTIHGGDGNDTISFNANHGVAHVDGGRGDDQLYGTAASGHVLELDGGVGSDTLSTGSGVCYFTGGAGSDRFTLSSKEVYGLDMVSVTDFASGLDLLTVRQGSLPVGNGDLMVDGAVAVSGPGGFDASAELVIVTANITGELTLDKAAAAIGSANGAYADGQTVVFMVDNGTQSWALYFESDGTDAAVSAPELSVLGRLTGTPSTAIDDILWGA
ncbi:calcium-binding protein [Ideonella sp. YS5]|uniref:calcium-binding protein n=1 Tax=Ideonella sp. YS5 TaxID=3453714 RepID=UPI003EE999A9